MLRFTVFTFLSLFVFTDSYAQKKIYGLPEAFERPKDYFDMGKQAVEKQLYENTGNKSDNPWLVFSDRAVNPIFESPDVSSKVVMNADFKSHFYMTDEKDGRIKIALANSPGKKLKAQNINELGWIQKKNMLLWYAGLVDRRTDINKKAFLLNRADDIKSVIERKKNMKSLTVDIFTEPTSRNMIGDRSIYDYYFVYKKENGMLLIGEEENMNIMNVESKLPGWVSERRVQEWNTRLSLEPNFDESAFMERKVNPQYQFCGFGKESDVKGYVNGGSKSGAYWANDPVKFNPKDMASSNPRRFNGSVMRFPMFGKDNIDGAEFFRSGTIGRIKLLSNSNGGIEIEGEMEEKELALMKGVLTKMSSKNKNVNVFFVTEGTDKTHAFKENIADMIRGLSRNKELGQAVNVRFGALIYRDVPEGDRITEYKKLTTDGESVAEFISNADFVNRRDQDDYTARYYGLKKSIQIAGFNKNQTNIIFMLGSCGDYSIEPGRRAAAEAGNEPSLITDKAEIFRELTEIGAHLHSVQLHNDGERMTGTAFAIQSQYLILETAKYIYNKQSTDSKWKKLGAGMQLQVPVMATPVGVERVDVKSSKPGTLILPAKLQSVTGSRLAEGVNDMLSASLQYNDAIYKALNQALKGGGINDVPKMYKEGNIDIPGILSGMATALEDHMQSTGASDNTVSEANNMKLSLYTEIFIPLKGQGARYPLYSYVLFMPESDFLKYQNLIERNINQIANSGSYDEKRKSLFKIYKSLVQKFAGQTFKSDKEIEDLTRKDVLEIMQGLNKEGLDAEISFNIRIGDIRDEKKVNNQEVDALIKRFNDVKLELDRINKLNDRYEFRFETDESNRYYWLTLDQVF